MPQPVTHGQVLPLHLHEVPRGARLRETGRRAAGARGRGTRGLFGGCGVAVGEDGKSSEGGDKPSRTRLVLPTVEDALTMVNSVTRILLQLKKINGPLSWDVPLAHGCIFNNIGPLKTYLAETRCRPG